MLLRKHRIVSWCNGSTTVFGSVCRGSNPRETTHNPNKPFIINMIVSGFSFGVRIGGRIYATLMLHKNKSPITNIGNKTLFVIDKLQISWRYVNIRNSSNKAMCCYVP